ncbi:uncharacterized protein METZ01_LOCUS199142, partial [marine metagenome]
MATDTGKGATMPEVDYVILCDYARIENGVAFIS